MNCSTGWTTQSELSIVPNCQIPIIGVFALKIPVIILAGFIFLFELIVFGYNWANIMEKKKPPMILLFWSMFQNIVMLLYPAISIGLNIFPENTLWLAFIMHISAALAAGIVILFIYIQVKLLAKSSMGKTSWLYSNKKNILTVVGTIQAVLFLGGPFISHFSGVALNIMFWIPVIIVDFTVIPYFCILGILISNRISHMQRDDYKGTARKLLITVVICSLLGLFTGAVGIYAIIDNRYEWALIQLCWLADIVFNAIFFVMFVRNK